ncbi:prepilin-type N-terminal cleavage/methylation domain-containing protein [Nocardioides marinisabuli]|uniref:Prepilin-type N-terminal cleavage/methylation domain-containing protein n=1 Tax=Nocardioides marinisabuli TaxID=419476 RepID=A0A7Y9JQ52_9ACTN|nr:prepilin-type N-terminal cleavage/methylation domain-containing protein [Nocardioides marinisabuli]NYD57667.1 prepilin-type N-terminal cleavage/methylation domain-containing protein [Nocardioides marinisabuli]
MSAGRPRDAGFSLVEMLVGMALFAVLGTLLLGFAIGTTGVADDVRADSNTSGEARLAVERMTRELRQASEIRSVTIDDEGRVLAFTLGIDFDGQGGVEANAADDPEVLTYTWRPEERSLVLSGGGDSADVLAGGVVKADLRLRSSQWIHDTNGDGTTTWQEIDDSSVSTSDDQLDAAELALIDLVSVELEVQDGDTTRQFVVQADMRNRDGGPA